MQLTSYVSPCCVHSVLIVAHTWIQGLDPPFLLYFARLVKRTFLRLFRLSPQCAPGCSEMASEVFFSRDSILWWAITNHWPVKKRMQEWHMEDGIKRGGRMRRMGGWGSELKEWKAAVQEMMRRKNLLVSHSASKPICYPVHTNTSKICRMK